MSGGAQLAVRVSAVTPVAESIKRFRLEPVEAPALPLFSAGSHVIVTMHDGSRTFRNPYSLMGSPTDSSTYAISVLKTDHSRGGSRFMHEAVEPGMLLTISHPLNLFPIDHRGRKHLLIAGGIGITPLIAMAEELALLDRSFEVHYCFRGATRAAFADELAATYGRRVCLYRDDAGERLPLARLLDHQPLGTHLYVCGPEAMIDWVLATARVAGWPEESVHSERFLAPQGGTPFDVKLARSGLTIKVGEHESMLDAIEAAGVDARYLCRGGACGQCETVVLAARGELVHHDHYLTADQHCSGRQIMICVSRFKGSELVLDL
jgi:ferredoxin-NADP reductase